MRILIVKTAGLGDVLRTTALLPALHRQFDNVSVTWITSEDAKPLLYRNHLITRVAAPSDCLGGSSGFDWVLSLDEDSDLANFAAAFSTPRFSGIYADHDGTLRYTPDLAPWFGMGLLRPSEKGGLLQANEEKRNNTRSYEELLYDCLGLFPPVERSQLELSSCSLLKMRRWLMSVFDGNPKLLGLNSAAGTRWKHKTLPEAKTASVIAEILNRSSLRIVLLGGPQEEARNTRIAYLANDKNVVCAPAGLSLDDFSALVSLCSVVLSSDSLAMHIAISLEIPTVAFFGPTSASEIRLSDIGKKVETPLECKRCYLADCNVVPHCLEAIETLELASAVLKLVPRR